MLFTPIQTCDGSVEWPQLEFVQLVAASGVHQSGTTVVRVKEPVKAETVFPCIGLHGPREGHSARFSPAAVSPACSSLLVDGSPFILPKRVPLAPCSGGVSSGETAVSVGSNGWAFYAYCREPPPSLTLSTAGICSWLDPRSPLLAPLYDSFELVSVTKNNDFKNCPMPVIVIKRDLEPGDELLIAFNQFDGLGRLWSYPVPCPFLRVGAAVPLLNLPSSLQVVRIILASQESSSITDSYVKLLEDTAGLDARTTERLQVAMLNLTRAVKHYTENSGEIMPLPLVVPLSTTAVAHAVSSPVKRQRKHIPPPAAPASSMVPAFAASFRIPQSYVPK